MRAKPAVLVAALLGACTTTQPPPPTTQAAAGGGKALMVVGTIPLVGTDALIRDALRARHLEVEEVQEAQATTANAEGKRVVVLSFSMLSKNFKADYSDVRAPIIVLEHFLLPGLGMTADAGHGFQLNLTGLTIASDSTLAAGLSGDVTLYSRVGEMFWGVPAPGAIKVATAPGNPERSFLFAYPAGAMMVSKPAPARRLHFFFAVHAPPPVTTLYLNDHGLALLGAAIDWSLQ